jgi:hypothetical protein
MNNPKHADFSKFVPGFDFLQSLAKGQPGQMPGMPSWVAPTLDPKELDKRIDELKAVLFWLDQNGTALKATIQALEVQKMTLATLKSMNLDMSAMANAFKFPASPAAAAKPQPAAEHAAHSAHSKPAAGAGPSASHSAKATPPPVDPMQLWGSLAQQFQKIAAGAMQEVAKQAAASPMAAAKPGAADAGVKKTATPKARAAKKTAPPEP